jgi:hypothetical protein
VGVGEGVGLGLGVGACVGVGVGVMSSAQWRSSCLAGPWAECGFAISAPLVAAGLAHPPLSAADGQGYARTAAMTKAITPANGSITLVIVTVCSESECREPTKHTQNQRGTPRL